ncbi:MAG: hypothetical protein Q9216_006799, partial [Gyalolechia sp. 2 TL-2023]
IKPVPRAEGREPSEYQKFVKEHFRRVKGERPTMGMGEVMAVLGREFREMKERRKEDVIVVEENLVGSGESDGKENDVGLDSVVSKLDLLDLGSR